jgi:DNA-binding FrmR family transcriptional regulator
MIDEDRWCPQVVTQISSVNRALQEVAIGLMSDHLHHCVMNAVRDESSDGAAAVLDEVSSTLRQIVRL